MGDKTGNALAVSPRVCGGRILGLSFCVYVGALGWLAVLCGAHAQ